jgi:hypothetical protein
MSLARVEKFGDLYKPVLSLKQKVPSPVLKHLAGKTAGSRRKTMSESHQRW